MALGPQEEPIKGIGVAIKEAEAFLLWAKASWEAPKSAQRRAGVMLYRDKLIEALQAMPESRKRDG